MISLLGIAVLIGLGYLLSAKKGNINWRTVMTAFAIQAFVGAFILYFPPGKAMLLSISNVVNHVISYSSEGIEFLFGQVGDKSLGFIFAFNILPVIVFFSALITVLYYMGIMTWVIRILGGALQRLLHTSRPESMSAAANIFVGQTEAPIVVKPFIPTMTRSELFAVMVGGLASIAGSVLAGFAGIGVDINYLIAASFMAAPGGLMMAKLVMPETEQARNDLSDLKGKSDTDYANVFDAAASGASSGMYLAFNVGAMLLAFVALIALLNGVIGWVGDWFGMPELTFQVMLGYLFQPLAWVLGVPWHEAQQAGSLIGQKLVVNEFVAYLDFVEFKDDLSQGTQAIVTFALCGFANLSSIAILMGGLGTMAPERRQDIAEMGMRAVFAATLANLMSATIAGFLVYLGA